MISLHNEFIKKYKKEKWIILITQLVILFVFIFLWEILSLTNIIDPFIFSRPSQIVSLFVKYLSTNELLIHTLVSTYEVVIGLVLGTSLGLLIAIILYEFPILAKIFDPFLIVFNALPKTALAPILIIWVGANIKGIVVVSISISLVITVINALNAFNNIDSEKIKLFKTFEASKIQILRYLILPATLNDILNIIRINIGMSWIGVIVGEFIVSKKGLGYLITYGTQVFRLDIVMMGIVTLSVVTMLMYKILNLIAKIIKRNNRI